VLPDGSVIVLTEPSAYSGEAIAEDITRLLTALLVGVLIAAAAGYFLARWLARPLRDAATAAQQMAAGRRDVEVAPSGPMEVAEVADSLNELNAALTTSEGRQREFLLSVSHELRTPLTSLRGYAEALNDGVVAADQVPQTAAVMVSESQRLERMVADLLDLARMGARDVEITMADVNVTDVLEQTAEVWSENSRKEGVRFTAEIPSQPLPVSTDAVRLRQILDNLLTNALRMTPAGQDIVLAGRDLGDAVEVQVRDGGPGLSSDDLAVAFEPAELYSRYRGVRPVGSGVGLALVGRLSQRLGGNARAESAAEGGASFTVTLPKRPPSSVV
jgi:two-component system, OmpR family, sensor kinase